MTRYLRGRLASVGLAQARPNELLVLSMIVTTFKILCEILGILTQVARVKCWITVTIQKLAVRGQHYDCLGEIL